MHKESNSIPDMRVIVQLRWRAGMVTSAGLPGHYNIHHGVLGNYAKASGISFIAQIQCGIYPQDIGHSRIINTGYYRLILENINKSGCECPGTFYPPIVVMLRISHPKTLHDVYMYYYNSKNMYHRELTMLFRMVK